MRPAIQILVLSYKLERLSNQIAEFPRMSDRELFRATPDNVRAYQEALQQLQKFSDSLSRLMFQLYHVGAFGRSEISENSYYGFEGAVQIRGDDGEKEWHLFAEFFGSWIHYYLGIHGPDMHGATFETIETCARLLAQWMFEHHDADQKLRRGLLQFALWNSGMGYREVALKVRSAYGGKWNRITIKTNTHEFVEKQGLKELMRRFHSGRPKGKKMVGKNPKKTTNKRVR